MDNQETNPRTPHLRTVGSTRRRPLMIEDGESGFNLESWLVNLDKELEQTPTYDSGRSRTIHRVHRKLCQARDSAFLHKIISVPSITAARGLSSWRSTRSVSWCASWEASLTRARTTISLHRRVTMRGQRLRNSGILQMPWRSWSRGPEDAILWTSIQRSRVTSSSGWCYSTVASWSNCRACITSATRPRGGPTR